MGGIYALGDQVPEVHPDAFVHPDAVVIGSVTIGAGASIWPAAVLRGDYGRIEVGTVVHTTDDWPTAIGAGCVVGHNVHVEGCTIGDGCLVGSGSIVLNRARVESGSAVGAAALVTEDSVVATGEIALGVPARVRPAPEDLAKWVGEAVEIYLAGAKRYRTELRRIG